jgi:hypothetical protein
MLPPRALLSALWVFVFAISLRYCQVSINVERQYVYIHMLEEKISQALGDLDLYRRESAAHLKDYPAFSNWAWFSYVLIFPFLALATAVGLAILEWVRFTRDWPYNVFDSGLAVATAVSFFLYRMLTIGRRAGTGRTLTIQTIGGFGMCGTAIYVELNISRLMLTRGLCRVGW